MSLNHHRLIIQCSLHCFKVQTERIKTVIRYPKPGGKKHFLVKILINTSSQMEGLSYVACHSFLEPFLSVILLLFIWAWAHSFDLQLSHPTSFSITNFKSYTDSNVTIWNAFLYQFWFCLFRKQNEVSVETQSCGANGILEKGTGSQPFRTVNENIHFFY